MRRGEKENHRPPPEHEEDDADVEIARIEPEILRLSSRFLHLRVFQGHDAQPTGTGPWARGLSLALLDLDVVVVVVCPWRRRCRLFSTPFGAPQSVFLVSTRPFYPATGAASSRDPDHGSSNKISEKAEDNQRVPCH